MTYGLQSTDEMGELWLQFLPNPAHFKALNNLGLLLLRDRKYDAAEESFRAALRAHPGDQKVKDSLEILARARAGLN